ncbi:MAG: hypothetical protein GWN16_04070 [Calditrichae bacterium]|nr:hypothetical protein [Calditrichia bacterium]
MENFKKVAILENEFEAQVLEDVLKELGIPHYIRSYHDRAYNGIFQNQKGWGHIEAPPEYHDEILSILADLKQGNFDINK